MSRYPEGESPSEHECSFCWPYDCQEDHEDEDATYPHEFRIEHGLWWCQDEDVVSEDCTDYNRCDNQCVCNGGLDEDEYE